MRDRRRGGRVTMDLVIGLHSHLPYVLHHGRWPHGSDWLSEAAVDTYLPLLEALLGLEVEGVASPITLGITPILANQLAHPSFGTELQAFLTQRLSACDEAIGAFERDREPTLIPIAEYWRGRLARMERLFHRIDGDAIGQLRRLEDQGRLELISSAATHGFLPLLGRVESIELQLLVGRREHRRLFGRDPRGCWVPECAYRPRGDWQPLAGVAVQRNRPGVEEHLAGHHYRYFFTDSHLAQAGRTLGLYAEPGLPGADQLAPDDPLNLPAARSPYRPYRVSPRGGDTVATLVRDPVASRQVWSRHLGYPGDGGYLEFHKIRFPGGLKLWQVTDPSIDLGAKLPYDPNAARARAHRHAEHYAALLRDLAIAQTRDGQVIAVPFDTELFGHWWFEGVDFLADLYRALQRTPGSPRPATGSDHLERHPARTAVELAEGSWGANGDFSKWLNSETEWTWRSLWSVEAAFWEAAPAALERPARRAVLAQAARELLLAQSSDWQFIISSGTAVDYASRRFAEHVDNCRRLLAGLDDPSGPSDAVREEAAGLGQLNDVFPDVADAVADVVSARR
ncbi:MAG: 1,4-alpha-glucan branching protein domain-containing protein [Gemmatimonadales bacterium]